MKHNYHAFGFNIESPWPLPLSEVSSDITTADCSIDLSEINHSRGFNFEAFGLRLKIDSENIFLLVDGIAHYHCQPYRIDIHPLTKCEDDIAAFLLYAALPYWLLLRGKWLVRGCALSWNEKESILLLSPPGGGSSTLAGYALRQGAKLVSDHFCVVTEREEGVLMVEPGIRHLRLWKAAADQLQIDHHLLRPIRPCLQQFFFKTENIFSNRPLPISGVISIDTMNKKEDVSVKKLTGVHKMDNLDLRHYHLFLFKKLGYQKIYQRLLMKLANQVSLYHLTRWVGQQPLDLVWKELNSIFLEYIPQEV
ncbi:MAG: hypothetical protein HYS07_05360 [Chlamydiae bacterium]|nr:hypothetical protein [Chlamydiota bacterium]MBI3278015.1 hypothetical protein [Chlamydiota bacterium]